MPTLSEYHAWMQASAGASRDAFAIARSFKKTGAADPVISHVEAAAWAASHLGASAGACAIVKAIETNP